MLVKIATGICKDSKIKKRYSSLSSEEKRKQNVQKHGNNSNMEREVAIEIKAMFAKMFPNIKVIILNDGTRADILVQRSDMLFFQIQLKTTGGPQKYQNNCWSFSHVLGYTGMSVLCWRIDQQSGWLYDGTLLDERGTRDLHVTPGFDNENKAMHKGALKLDEICTFIVNVMNKFPGVDETLARWDFSGNAIENFKERVSIEIWKIYFDPEATFPADQNGSYDLISEEKRLQFKTARRCKNRNGLHINLCESGGIIDGKKKFQPYASGSFDLLVVMFLDWKLNKVHIWKIPEDILIQKKLLRTDNCQGRQMIDVYIPAEKHALRLRKSGESFADTWTHDFYIGTKDIPNFGIEAETVTAKFFAECRDSNSKL